MSNVIKYTTTPVNDTIKKGNFALGINDVDYGPTNITGFYATTIPSTSGYTIYNQSGGTLSYQSVSGTTDLINYLSNKRGVNMTTAGEALSWAAGQSSIFVTNREYENIVTSGMVLNLDAGFVSSYPTSATTWYDLSYSGYNGTLTNGPTFSSLSGGSIVFDGTNDYVLINRPSEITTGGSITVSLWAKWTTVGTTISTIQALVDNNHSGSPVQGFIIQDRPDLNKSIQFGVFPNTNGSTSTFQVGNGTWKHITGTYVTGSNRLYIDGSLNASITAEPSMATVQPYISLGYWQFTPSRYMNGNIANVQIYNRALSPFEVYQNYNSMKGRFGIPDIVTSGLTLNLDAGNPYSYNPLNTGSTTWTDVSGYNNNGTLINGTYYSGGTMVFDGVDDYVNLPSNFTNITSCTYVFVLNLNSVTGSVKGLIGYGNNSSNYTCNFRICSSGDGIPTVGNSRLAIRAYNPPSSIDNTIIGQTNINVNTTYIVAFVISNTSYKIYINGVEETLTVGGTNNGKWIANCSSTPTNIAISSVYYNGAYSNFLSGKLPVAQIYDRALSASEVQQNFNALRGRYGI
jgi:hypothetical protein